MTSSELPEPRRPGETYRIDLVCMGNICRSPMAAVVLRRRVEELGLDVEVVSSGTGGWHVGNPMDRRAATLLTAHGYDASAHRAQQLDPAWIEESDLVLVMDEDNLADVLAARAAAGGGDGSLERGGDGGLEGAGDGGVHDGDRIRLFRSFDPRARDGERAVPDPYYGGDDGFTVVLAMIERTCDALAEQLASTGAGR